ncbi:phosphohexomutase domain-containing protein [Halococcoides cellulosivorans]|uniref:Phosphomannomutase n=1 Tax=Halococcoides cellulosivorans TaxID=1679096 RepID=A0A2R4WZQ7_9EURY|nr:phosphomannomutase [Halococcoides cellulosivorans]AWB27010.1 phosphomannomutase [Halococcoides cellulosivorans]
MDLFGTSGVRGPVGETVTLERALALGTAAGQDGEEFVLGRDGRTTGRAIADAVAAGLQRAGARVERIGVVPTPTLAWASQGRRGIMVTASHNPPRDNGLKFFRDGQEYDRDAERRLESRLDTAPASVDALEFGETTRGDPLSAYRDRIVAYARERVGPIAATGVVVDCGTGVGGLATPQVLDRLGADVLAVDAHVDGTFPARPSKPTADTLTDTAALIARTDRIDCAIAHDGDADRTVLLDSEGEIVPADTVLAILAGHYLTEGGRVLTTPDTSDRIDERVADLGGRVDRTALGTLHEAMDGQEATAETVFAGEPWKHVHPPLGPWIDGIASAALLVALIDRDGLAALRNPITERPKAERSVDCPDDAKAAAMDRLTERLPAAIDHESVDTDYGVRLTLSEGWILVRPSGTEPKLRVYLEQSDADALAERVVEILREAVERVA